MSTSTFPVGPTCAAIYGRGFPGPLTVKNTGAATIYLSSIDTGTNPSGFPLGAGSSQQWDQNRPLFALTAAGAGTLLVLENAGNLFDAQAIAAAITISGAPPVDSLTQILKVTYRPVADPTAGLFSGMQDVAAFQSLIVLVKDRGTDLTYLTPAPRKINVVWQEDTGIVVGVDTFYVTDFGTLPVSCQPGSTKPGW